jgi:deoxycytidine triphosphate deaminase
MYYDARFIREHIQKGHIKIEPYIEQFQGPNMYYCHLGSAILKPQAGKIADTRNISDDLYERSEIKNYYDLKPDEFILAETFETFMTDNSHIIRLFNSSSLARLGIVQCAVGMINPGCGITVPHRLTLELSNTGPFTVRLYPTIVSDQTGELKHAGTEVLKVAVMDHKEVEVAYEQWGGAIHAYDKEVAGTKIDRRFT